MLTRRGLFGMLAAAAADPERLVWRPKFYSIPSSRLFSELAAAVGEPEPIAILYDGPRVVGWIQKVTLNGREYNVKMYA